MTPIRQAASSGASDLQPLPRLDRAYGVHVAADELLPHTDNSVALLDKLSHAGDRRALAVLPTSRCRPVGDVTNAELGDGLVAHHDVVAQFAKPPRAPYGRAEGGRLPTRCL